MLITEEELKKYTCSLEGKFMQQFRNDYLDIQESMFDPGSYNTNDILDFLLDYPEVNDKSKQYFYFMCMKTFKDVSVALQKKYNAKFGIISCGTEIYNSYACAHGNLLINCNGIKHSFGCNKCKFSDHLLYCTEQRHKSYMAFNKQITKQRFEQLIKLSPSELEQTPEFNGAIYAQINSLIEHIYKLKEKSNA